jgi:uncharacterized damage-inducible protein DinB
MARTGFFPSLRATLNHILIVDLFYVDAMEGGTLGPAVKPIFKMTAPVYAQHDLVDWSERHTIHAPIW